MNRMRSLRYVCLVGLVVFLAAGLAGAGITIVNLPSDSPNFVLEADCGGVTPGGTKLPMMGQMGYWPSRLMDSVIDALEWQFGTTTIHLGDGKTAQRDPEDVWTFQWGDDLNGTLTIDHYKAYDTHRDGICGHGAQFSCHYFPADTDPDNLAWVQVFGASYDKLGIPSGTAIVDPFANDGTDDAPFYFSDLDDPKKLYYPASIPADSIIFGDTPIFEHYEDTAWSGWLRLNLFLASWDDATHELTIHDGIRWGYDGQCVPAPMSVVLGMIGLALVHRMRGRRSDSAG
ncbi:MAG TPA: hypothetical protein VFJ30_13130 [Phycisphaerae bacterium]|nr:hypothetical protein [Phycisphaerae bacterium]